MESQTQETPRQFNSDENRAFETQGERELGSHSQTNSFTKDVAENEDKIGRSMFPKEGKLTDLCILIEEMNMNDAVIEFRIKTADAGKSNIIHEFRLKEGFTELEEIDIRAGDRLIILVNDLPETEMRGVWIAFNYKQGG